MGWWAKSGTAHNQHATYTRNSNLLRPKTYKKIVDKGERMITSLFYKLRLPRPKKRNVNFTYVSNNALGPRFTWNYIILEFLSIFWKYFYSLLKKLRSIPHVSRSRLETYDPAPASHYIYPSLNCLMWQHWNNSAPRRTFANYLYIFLRNAPYFISLTISALWFSKCQPFDVILLFSGG